MSAVYLTIDGVMRLHVIALENGGGMGGVRSQQLPLRLLHSESTLSQVKLALFRPISTAELVESLRPGKAGCLLTRPDGTVLEGHHQLVVLRERGIDIDRLPREVLRRENGE